jgi:hypothetical protein
MKATNKEPTLEQHWADLKRFKSRSKKKGREFNEEYEQRMGGIVLEEFRIIWESRGGGEKVSLPEALGLLIAVMWKNNYTTPWFNSPYIIRLFYNEIAVDIYQKEDLLRSDFDKAMMNFLIREAQDQQRTDPDSFGKGFPCIINAMCTTSIKMRSLRGGGESSEDQVPHYKSIRLMEQMLDYVKYWFEKELRKDRPFDVQRTDKISDPKEAAEIERKRQVRIESAKLMMERIDSFFQNEQVPFWQKHQQEYLKIWKEEHRREVHIWKREFNIFKKYLLGEELLEDIQGTYAEDVYGNIYNEDGMDEVHTWQAEASDQFSKGMVVSPMVFGRLAICNSHFHSIGDRDKELEGLLLSKYGEVIGPQANTLLGLAETIAIMINYRLDPIRYKVDLKKGIDNEARATASTYCTGAIMEYIRLVREDSKLNRIRMIGMGEKGDEQGRKIGGDSLGGNITVNSIPGAGYLSDIYEGVKARLFPRKAPVPSEKSNVKIEELEEEESQGSIKSSSGENSPEISDDEKAEGSGVEDTRLKGSNIKVGTSAKERGLWWSWLFSSGGKDESKGEERSSSDSEEEPKEKAKTVGNEDAKLINSFQSGQRRPPPSKMQEDGSEKGRKMKTQSLPKKNLESQVQMIGQRKMVIYPETESVMDSSKQRSALAEPTKGGLQKKPLSPKLKLQPGTIGEESRDLKEEPDSQKILSEQEKSLLKKQKKSEDKSSQISSQTEKSTKKTLNAKGRLFFNAATLIGVLGFLITILCAYYFRKFGSVSVSEEKLGVVANNIKLVVSGIFNNKPQNYQR